MGKPQPSPWVSLLSFLLIFAAAVLLVIAFAARNYGVGMRAKTLYDEATKFGWRNHEAVMRWVSTLEACDQETLSVIHKTAFLITLAMTLLVAEMLLLWADRV